MSSLKLVHAHNRTLLLESDGTINVPFSLYLNEKFDNPHTRESVAGGLRVLHRFLVAHHIDLPARALEGEGLHSVECKWLVELAYRPLEEVERMSDARIKRITVEGGLTRAMDVRGAVEPNTAKKRLDTTAEFLKWYLMQLLDRGVHSPATREQLRARYEVAFNELNRIHGTKQGHANEVRSLPVEHYLRIIRELVLNPEQLFCLKDGTPSPTMMRDRSMCLLAAEGVRPGGIGNMGIDDFRYKPGDSRGYAVIKDNVVKRGTPVTTGVPKAKGTRSTLLAYNSNISIRLWPFTCIAIQEYIDGERAQLLGRRLANRSKSFLFLADHGGPIGDRSTITRVFNNLGKRLKELGFLTIARGDPYAQGSHYEFTAYTLRHSAGTMFFSENKDKPDVKDLMRTRFGWTAQSEMPDRYANRAMMDAASVDMSQFHEELLQALATKWNNRR